MHKRNYSAHIVVASRGDGVPHIVDTPYGPMRSRDAAELNYTANDANAVFSRWEEHSNLSQEFRVLLIDPTLSQLEDEIRKVSAALRDYPQGQTGIDFAFFGHGRQGTGDLVLRGGDLSAKRLLELQAADLNADMEGSRGVAIFLDSCFAGAFLANLIYEAYIARHENFLIFDASLSSYPNEASWELSFLEHGAFTYTFLFRGNAHVSRAELQSAIDRQDHRIIARCLQGLISAMADATSYLTQGRQHSVDIISAHSAIDILPADTVESLMNKLMVLRSNP